MTGRSSSWKRISGDVPLTQVQKLQYRLNAWVERLLQPIETFPVAVEPYIPVLDIDRLEKSFGEPVLVASPTRALCFDFIQEKLPEFFTPGARILDLGCGYGLYSRHLNAVLDCADYQGVDIQARPTWEDLTKSGATFREATLGEHMIDVNGANCIFTQSVLEHVQFDCSVFGLLKSDEAVEIQHVHFVPAPHSFAEHRYHGFRRFGPKAISRLLDDSSIFDVKIYSMGNDVTREMYWRQKGKVKTYQTRNGRLEYLYEQEKSCVENLGLNKEIIVPKNPREASFYALVFKQHVGSVD
ncbi:hypothetical protein E1180_15985 [Roseibium denhamense]|uniref:Methyltransferase domain-containing protein n=1 Tax=Roseibium denhamense TaxID=76305 RepID=A0ABY1PLF6_9HYPH|nr:class I SAM-dependent methyltransferase [Roseibium denhamense]MTI07011.1 hypothetical protein [Roseibium denhamense]SMP36576.1 hypothetical protein SAMN06265374_4205 [Roseibium denhamense]